LLSFALVRRTLGIVALFRGKISIRAMTMSVLKIYALALVPGAFAAQAEPVTYQVSGILNKDAGSDRIYGAARDRIELQIAFEADVSSAIPVEAGTATNLPNFPAAKFAENGFHLPKTGVRSLTFSLSSGTARFTVADLIGDPSSPGAVFLTGSLQKPTAIHILLASAQHGYIEIGIPDCSDTCRLKDGIVLDQAGPFGSISSIEIKRVRHVRH
jgi:hypothetical protein